MRTVRGIFCDHCAVALPSDHYGVASIALPGGYIASADLCNQCRAALEDWNAKFAPTAARKAEDYRREHSR